MTREALKLALEALEDLGMKHFENTGEVLYKVTFTAIKEALAQPEQEPVAWMCADESLINKGYARFSHVCMGDWKIPVYTTPPQRTWVWLTNEEIKQMGLSNYIKVVRETEAKLKEKNNG